MGDGWSRWSRLYGLQLPLERPALRALVALLDVSETDSLLDLGTGTAALLGELARSAHLPRSAVGIDSSARMLGRAPPLPRGWRLVESDARELPFADGSFGVLTASYLLHLLDQDARGRVIGEIRRVLAPGGRVGVVTVAPPPSALGALIFRPVGALAERSRGAFGGLRPLDPRQELLAAGCARFGRAG